MWAMLRQTENDPDGFEVHLDLSTLQWDAKTNKQLGKLEDYTIDETQLRCVSNRRLFLMFRLWRPEFPLPLVVVGEKERELSRHLKDLFNNKQVSGMIDPDCGFPVLVIQKDEKMGEKEAKRIYGSIARTVNNNICLLLNREQHETPKYGATHTVFDLGKKEQRTDRFVLAPRPLLGKMTLFV
jgi:hypothetical protein